MGAAGLEQGENWTHLQNPVVVMCMNDAEEERQNVWKRKQSRCLPLGVVGEKSFSDPTSDTCKNKKADFSGFVRLAETATILLQTIPLT